MNYQDYLELAALCLAAPLRDLASFAFAGMVLFSALFPVFEFVRRQMVKSRPQ